MYNQSCLFPIRDPTTDCVPTNKDRIFKVFLTNKDIIKVLVASQDGTFYRKHRFFMFERGKQKVFNHMRFFIFIKF